MQTTASMGEDSERGAGGWVLLLTSAHHVRALLLVDGQTVVIGRDPSCEVALDYDRVSRRHTRITLGATWTVEDLGSRNGTQLGATRVRDATKFVPGEPIGIGPFTAVVVPRAVSAVRLAAGGSALAIDDPALSRPGPLLSAIAHSPVSIVICAETGAGKEVLSRALHALSGRPGPFLGLNCAALAPQLLESELFGHDKGAFTGAVGKAGLLETAAGGSVLLDEIADMPREVQVKLLRAIEAREVLRVGGTRPIAIDVRFLAASHRPLPEACAAGAFRPDLYYRLAGITLTIPPLRERPAQIAQLAIRFALAATGRNDALSAAALARLAAHAWPGNVRELKNVVERAALLAGGDMIELDHLLFDPIPTSPPSTADASTSAPTSPVAAPATPAQLRSDLRARDERARIDEALGACGGNQTAAARRLGMSRATLTHRLDLLGIVRPRKR